MVIAIDVRPTAPAMIPTSKARLIAMACPGLCERVYQGCAEGVIDRYRTVASTARAP